MWFSIGTNSKEIPYIHHVNFQRKRKKSLSIYLHLEEEKFRILYIHIRILRPSITIINSKTRIEISVMKTFVESTMWTNERNSVYSPRKFST